MNQTLRYDDKPWLSFYEPGVPESVDYKRTLSHEFLEANTRANPDHTALIFQGFRMSYRDLNQAADAFAAYLQARGVKKGDAVALLLPNVIPCVAAFFGILKAGAVVVMNNPLYSDTELLHQFNDSGSRHLVTLDLLAQRMINLRPKTQIETIIVTSIGDYLPFPKNFLFPLVAKKKGLAAAYPSADNVFSWKAIIRQYKGALPEPVPGGLGLEDTAMYQYTGGTTGVSKGAVLTHGNLSRQVQQINAWLPELDADQPEVVLGALPFFHVMGMTVSMNFPMTRGWTIILVPKPQPEPLLEAMVKFKPTIAPMVPTMFIGVLNHPDTPSSDLSSIKACISGSAPLPLEVIRGFEEKTGSVIIEAFGLTESSPATHVNPFNPDKRKVGSIGIPLPDTRARIVDLEDPAKEVPVGKPGELIIKGPQIMKGYRNMPEETEATLINGWLHTGDIAYMDQEGYFYIVDRKKDMIISGGYNVYPRDIDEVLFTHPQVLEACAVGIPHPTRGEQIKAFVVAEPGSTVTEEDLIQFCGDHLAKYKWPTQIEFIEELPKTNVGKVLRKDLRAQEIAKLEQNQ